MTVQTHSFTVATHGKGTYEITERVRELVTVSGARDGIATVFVQHTSASLVIFENADPSARADLHAYFEKLVPEDPRGYTHTLEGPDDMTSHIRMALTRTSESIPVADGQLALGAWQGIFLFERRRQPHTRRVIVSVLGN